jgi:hypothetical protein
MFGAGIPYLFPVAVLSFIILYSCERLLVAYSYKQPPAFDEMLNKSCINILVWAPQLYFIIGFWMMGNK